jgi:protein O-mannosyl-transferase
MTRSVLHRRPARTSTALHSSLHPGPPPGAGARAGWTRWAAPVLVAALTAAAFLPALHNELLNWDDAKNYLDNPHYRGLGPRQLAWMFTTFHMGHYIPVTWLTFGLDYRLWGMSPAGYHLTNILFHAATALAVYFLSLRLLRTALPGITAADYWIGATTAALLFAIHPLRAESVAWVTERRDVVSGLFYVLCVVAYLKAVDGAHRVKPRWYWTSVGLFACGLLSKSIVVSLPVVLIALDVYPLERLGGERGWRRPHVWLEKVPYLALGGAAAVIGFLALFTTGNTRSLAEMGLLYRAVLSIYGLAFYLWKSVMPFGLSPLYQLDFTVTWLHFGAVAMLLGFALLMRRRWPAFTVATVAYVATLLPVLGIFQNGPQAAADRYTYLACLGWAVILGGLAARRWPGRDVTRVALSIWVLAMLPLTWQQVTVWHDSVSLWSHAIALAPQSRAAHFNLAGAHEEAGRYAAAVAEYENVARLSNRFKGRWYITIGWNYEKAKVDRLALAAFRTALSLEPGLTDACEGVIRIADRLGVAAGPRPGCPE